jgi:vancomycin resistance protein VanW
MLWRKDILFCDINPTCYAISLEKEICKRHIQNLTCKEKFAKTFKDDKLPNIVSSHDSNLIKRGKGIDPVLQENKATNIMLACKAMNGIIIHPGEVFSFWKLVGNTTKRKGYKDGRVIIGNKLKPGRGGGLCNLANTIHLLILHSPLDVTEFHKHSDALAPDEGKRVPFSSGTSVSYNNIDYRFKNNTSQNIQLLVWCDNNRLYAELRSEQEFPWTYELVEEDHHFKKEGEKYYRNSKIYRNRIERSTGNTLEKELILNNHSEVMFDYSLIPQELIR